MEIQSIRIAFFLAILLVFSSCTKSSTPDVGVAEEQAVLNVAISPYQDIAMLVNAEHLGLEEVYDLDLELHTLAWEDILPAVASRADDIDVGFGSYLEFLSKQHNLWQNAGDEVLFIAPAYIYQGGGFITFQPEVKKLSGDLAFDAAAIREFLDFKIGVQKASNYETMLHVLAGRAGLSPSDVKTIESDMDSALLAAINGSLDIAGAGLTQINEANRNGGRLVLTMNDMGFADITGFIAKRSTYESKKVEIDRLLRMWFESVDYVLSDIDNNAGETLEYLAANAATTYTVDSFRQAVGQEYFPRSLQEARREIVSDSGTYSFRRIGKEYSQLLLEQDRIPQMPELPNWDL